MGFDMKRNPLEENPLFSVPEQAADEQEQKQDSTGSAEKPAKRAVQRGKKKVVPDTTKTAKAPQIASEKLSEGIAYTRATFIVREDLLHKLKAYAYTERREIKSVINEILAQTMERVERDYAKRGESLIEPPEK